MSVPGPVSCPFRVRFFVGSVSGFMSLPGPVFCPFRVRFLSHRRFIEGAVEYGFGPHRLLTRYSEYSALKYEEQTMEISRRKIVRRERTRLCHIWKINIGI